MSDGGGDGASQPNAQPVQLDDQLQQFMQHLSEYVYERIQKCHPKDKKTPRKRGKKEPSTKIQALKKKEANHKAKYQKTKQEIRRVRIETIIENKEKSLKRDEEMRARRQTSMENKLKDLYKYKEKLETLKSQE